MNPMLALPILTASKDPDDQPHLGRRQLGIGLLAALGGGLGFRKDGAGVSQQRRRRIQRREPHSRPLRRGSGTAGSTGPRARPRPPNGSKSCRSP